MCQERERKKEEQAVSKVTTTDQGKEDTERLPVNESHVFQSQAHVTQKER